ncbi:MAG: NUDIX domain-containing protein [Candidatus Levybacteria bacterium]|nr:NUDIX domain-containing protein [Candidatus Levybacteria bacterium]
MNQSIILLTYKEKILLMAKDDILHALEHNPWHFIVGIKNANDSFEHAIYREVEKEMDIQLDEIKFLSQIISNGNCQYFYHASLTSDDVNRIVRKEGIMLQFFAFKELRTLSLSDSTKLLVEKHKEVFEKINESEKLGKLSQQAQDKYL